MSTTVAHLQRCMLKVSPNLSPLISQNSVKIDNLANSPSRLDSIPWWRSRASIAGSVMISLVVPHACVCIRASSLVLGLLKSRGLLIMHGLLSVKFNCAIPVIILYTLWFLCYVRAVFRGWFFLCCNFSEINKVQLHEQSPIYMTLPVRI